MPSTLLSWFTRMPRALRTAGSREADDAQALFDHVDGHELHAGEFRASGSMEFQRAAQVDFADTMPAWAAAASVAGASPSWR